MKMTPRAFFLTGLAIIVAGCTAPTSNETVAETPAPSAATIKTSSVTLGPAVSTVKPGASVSFSHETSGPVAVDGNGYVIFTINEGYPVGTLDLMASSNEGLDVFGPGSTQTVSMADGTTHTWRVDFTGLTDGVHYLRIRATAKPSAETGLSRGYAARIEVGDWKTAEDARKAAKPMEMQADGEMAVVLSADETIE